MIDKNLYIHVGVDEAYKNYKAESMISEEVETYYESIEYKMKRPDLLGKTLHVTKNQFSNVYKIVEDLSVQLEMEQPEVYVFEDFFYGIESYGMKNYWIEVSAKTIRDFSISELTFLFARELYKIKEGVVYNTMLKNQVFQLQDRVPTIGSMLKKGSQVSFYHWCRLENYTADNFGYLCCKDLTACIRAIVAMVLNSKLMLSEIDMSEFVRQASEINKLDDEVSSYTKADESLPYAPMRVESLLAYAMSRRGMLARKEC